MRQGVIWNSTRHVPPADGLPVATLSLSLAPGRGSHWETAFTLNTRLKASFTPR